MDIVNYATATSGHNTKIVHSCLTGGVPNEGSTNNAWSVFSLFHHCFPQSSNRLEGNFSNLSKESEGMLRNVKSK